MRKIMTITRRVVAPLLLFFFTLSGFDTQAQGDAINGATLFKKNCGSCHKLNKISTGPALYGVTEKRTREWLHSWIKDNVAFRASGDDEAKAIFAEFGGKSMNAFPYLTEENIDDILAYTVEGDQQAEGGDVVIVGKTDDKDDYSLFILIALGFLFFLLVAVLIKMKNTLRAVQGLESESVGDEVKGIWGAFVKNQFVVTITTIVTGVFFLYQLYWYLMQIGVDTNYQPVQPIAFSHEIHAGQNDIDCNYCHSSARNSKTSGIPSVNVCMNCHMNIDGSEIKVNNKLKYDGEPSPEIAKIYASVGWDPEKVAYKKDHVQKPIEWVRVHNLPDFVYFNHSQHVTVGGVKCETCHGPVKEMEEMYQHSELTMGWCVDCHRNTEVKVESNAYYAEFHDKLKKEYQGQAITVDKIGGLECGKCHY